MQVKATTFLRFAPFAFMFALCGCMLETGEDDPGSAQYDDDAVGSVSIELTTTPTAVRCVRVTVVGAASTTLSFNLTGGQTTAALDLGKLAAGPATFSALAYNIVCSSVTAASIADWVGAPVTAQVRLGINPNVKLSLRPNVSSTVDVDFQAPIAQLGASRVNSYAVRSDGTVWAWGLPHYGSLGDGSQFGQARLVPAVASMFGNTVVSIRGGVASSHLCLITTAARARCWGFNSSGQIGDGTTTNQLAPVEVGPSSIVETALGDAFTCLRTSSDTIYCAGQGSRGQLGRGSVTNSSTFVTTIANTDPDGAAEVVAGAATACVRKNNNVVWCWGANDAGQIGNGTSGTDALVPTITSLRGAIGLAAGQSHFCALKGDGTVWCWGANGSGQLGDGTTTARSAPVKVSGLSTAVEIAAAASTSCARLGDETVKCWGDDEYGTSGTGTGTSQLTPGTVRGLTGAQSIVMGRHHACALTLSGKIQCWGDNTEGQLGDGTNESRPTPESVIW